jgi:cytochrome c peroxidase
MRKLLVISLLLSVIIFSVSFTSNENDLRRIYSLSPEKWPKPFVDSGVQWQELGLLPVSPLQSKLDSLNHLIALGKILFFDPRLSGSGKIACVTCHQPELSWTDGKERSLGHEGQMNKRNSPSLQNVWFYKKLFWDGRARDLEDQAFAPINSESEMHNDMRELPGNLRKVKAYAALFDSAFGDPGIDPDRIASALATFQRTIVSQQNRFDKFLAGDTKALTNSELKGLHLFRTKARCINCHNGPLFSDNQFHNNGFSMGDPGLYSVTHKDEDRGKMKTPSLRDVAYTGPWMQMGHFESLERVINWYTHAKFSYAPGADQLLKPLNLNEREKKDLVTFLKAISAPPVKFIKPVLPG